jgi:putative toxin-antitoxin system antitoxin component (TIGR02293 family)
MSLRTFQRCRDPTASARPLTSEQSAHTWKFAEILAQATDVLGSQAEAEAWMERPAIGLEQHRPIDLLTTPAGDRVPLGPSPWLPRLLGWLPTSVRRLHSYYGKA